MHYIFVFHVIIPIIFNPKRMTSSIIYFTGLILTILGVIGVFSKIGPAILSYIILGLGLVILVVFFVKQNRSRKHTDAIS